MRHAILFFISVVLYGQASFPPGAGGGSGSGDAAETITVSYSATPTCTATANTVTVCAITLTGNVTSCTLAGFTSGQAVTWRITQDGTGGRTFACASLTGLGPVDTTASAVSSQDFRATSSSAATAAGGMTGTSSNVLLTDAANTGAAAFTLNASASTSDEAIRVPNVAGAANTSNGAISYDTTNKNMHAGTNGADGILPVVASVPTNGNCPKWVVSSSKVSLSDDTCSGGSSMFSTSGTGNTWVFGPPQYVAGAALVGAVNRVVYFEFSTGDTFTFTKLLGYQGTGVGGMHYALAIYDSSCTLLQGGSTVTSSGFSPFTSTVSSTTVTPGTYFLALTADDTGMGYYTNNSGTLHALVLNQESTKRVFYGANASTGTSTLTFPGTCGARTSLTVDVPVIALVP